jgi:hypothetical protein
VTTLVDRLEADGLVRRVDDLRTGAQAGRAHGSRQGKGGGGCASSGGCRKGFAESLGPTERLALAKVLSSISKCVFGGILQI